MLKYYLSQIDTISKKISLSTKSKIDLSLYLVGNVSFALVETTSSLLLDIGVIIVIIISYLNFFQILFTPNFGILIALQRYVKYH